MAEGSEAMCDVEDIITRKRDYHPRKCRQCIDCTWFERKIGLVRFVKLCWSRFCISFGPSVDKDQCQGLRSVIQVVRNQITSEWIILIIGSLITFTPTVSKPQYNELLCNWKYDDLRSLQLLEINLGHFWLIWDILIYIRLSCRNNTSVLTTVYIDKLRAEAFTNN